MKRLFLAFMLRASRSRAIRRTFFLLPLGVRLRLRGLAVVPNSLSASTSSDFSEVVRNIRANSHLFEQSIEAKTSWKTKGFHPQVGNVEFQEPPNVADTYSVVTLDFWDTILGRVRPAEGAKRLTALRFSLLEWKSRGYSGHRLAAEDLHNRRLDSEAKQVTARGEAEGLKSIGAMDSSAQMTPATNQFLLKNEVLDEKKFTRELATVCSSDYLSRNNIEIISDFYMSADDLEEILSDKRISFEVRKIHSSMDYQKTKRGNGDLFLATGLPANQSWLHIGDSPHSDVAMSEKHGAKARLVERKLVTSWNRNDLDIEALASELDAHFDSDAAGRFLLDMSALGISLVTFAVERALSLGRTQVLYLSREGETLARIHEFIAPHLRELGLPEVQPIYVKCSRASVFFPSYANNLQRGLEQLGLQYPVSTAGSLVDSLSLPSDLAEKIHVRFAKFQRFRTSRTLSYLDEDTIAAIQAHLDDQRKIFLVLAEQLGIIASEAVVCDLGWRGTINDSISRMIGTEIPGVYLGLNSPLDLRNQYKNKLGLLFDEPRGKEAPSGLAFFGPIERAFTISPSSTIRYEQHGQDVKFVYSNEPDAPAEGRRSLVDLELRKSVETMFDSLLSCGLFGFETEKFAAKIVENWMRNPGENHSGTWFDEVHGEGFGTSEVHYQNLHPNADWFNASGESLITKSMQASLWPEGYIRWSKIAQLANFEGRKDGV
jgi:hypothetical protein